MAKVSIIVPTYNVEQYLVECMESIINQTLQDIEIICVDDGATDNSGKILDDYAEKDSRIKVIHKQNEGYGKAMNVGLDTATGEYIGIVEPDDYVALDMFESLYKVAKENNVDFVKADFQRFVGEKNEKTFYYQKIVNNDEYYNKIVNIQDDQIPFRFIKNTWAGIYNREYLNKHNIRHNETPGASYQDNGFWFQTYCYSSKCYFSNKDFYRVRRDNPNSSINNKEKVFIIQDEYKFIYDILEKNGLLEKFKNIYYEAKYGSYFFCLKRIDNKYKKIWLEAFKDDFQKAIDNNEFDKEEINPRVYRNIKQITTNYQKWYRRFKKKRALGLLRQESIKNRFAKQISIRPNSRIMFWGASKFLKEFLDEREITTDNVIGILDKNPARKGSYFNGYEIYTPDEINDLKPNVVIISVLHIGEEQRKEIKDFIKKNCKHKVRVITVKD
ncbi:MAG: glycosyltransferase [Cyanobacteria bacterium SIG28]|nr:glycosyltransferase [Cyanobacteria bacterium SIG28]